MRRRRETEPTQRIAPLPRNGDRFWTWPLEVQRLVTEYVDSEREVRR